MKSVYEVKNAPLGREQWKAPTRTSMCNSQIKRESDLTQ